MRPATAPPNSFWPRGRSAAQPAERPHRYSRTTSYIKHHLTIAGRSDPLFSDDAVDLIHLSGLSRSVNNIALQSLIAAFVDEKSIVDESSARVAITETQATE